jgi:uncharacterized RDD family membrane protein YckC
MQILDDFSAEKNSKYPPPAHWFPRALAFVLDGLAVYLAVFLLVIFLPDLAWWFKRRGFTDVSLMLVLYLLLWLGYHLAMEYWYQQTLGKRLFDLRVLNAYGYRLSFLELLFRNLVKLLSFPASLPIVLWRLNYLGRWPQSQEPSEAQYIHDHVCNSYVAKVQP